MSPESKESALIPTSEVSVLTNPLTPEKEPWVWSDKYLSYLIQVEARRAAGIILEMIK